MLDVHLPHKPIHGFWEFLLHLFTISVGLLIATQIESCVEWQHHVHLAEEARADLRAEIKSNLEALKAAQPAVKQWRATINADLEAMQRIQEYPADSKAQHTSLTIKSSGMTLSDTVWRTAQSTGALAYMPYEEAERYSSIYQAQAALLAYQEKPADDVAGILGLITRYHWVGKRRITEEQASMIAERLGEMQLHLATGDLLLQRTIETSSAYLENRKARDSFTESVK